MIAIPFGGDLQFVVVGSPDYLHDHPVPTRPGDLMAHRCIQARWPRGSIYRWEFQKGGRSLAVDVPGALILDDASLMRQAALAGAGLVYIWDAHAALRAFIDVLRSVKSLRNSSGGV
jgi:DNA-binding transcriptional LysR family regulator